MRADYRETFARLALGQKPDCLFIACSDSRVVPNLFASTEPGDLFATRNVGNLVPPSGPGGVPTCDGAQAAASEFAVRTMGGRDIVVCGHSSCGAMRALVESAGTGLDDPGVAGGTSSAGGASTPRLTHWLQHALPALEKLEAGRALDPSLPRDD